MAEDEDDMFVDIASRFPNYNQKLKDLEYDLKKVDVGRELGLVREKNQRSMKTLALTNPTKFNDERDKAYDDMEGAVTVAFENAFNEYIEAGYTKEEAKREAMHVAETTKDSLVRAIRTTFGEDMSATAISRLGEKAAAERGLGVSFGGKKKR